MNLSRLGLSFTSIRKMNKAELIKEVKNRTEIGKTIARSQLEFIKWLAKLSQTGKHND